MNRVLLVFFISFFVSAEASASSGTERIADVAALTHAGTGAAAGSIGSKLMSVCSTKYGAWACPLAAQAFSQLMSSSKSAGGSGRTAVSADSGFTGGLFFPSGSNIGVDLDKLEAATSIRDPEIQKILKIGGLSSKEINRIIADTKELDKQGISGDGEIVGPNGEVVPASAFKNPDGLSDYGFSDKDIANLKGIYADGKKKILAAQSKYTTATLSFDRGGGGYGNKKRKAYSNETSYGDYNLNNNSLRNQLNKKRSVSGLTRSIAGERIGVAGDDIFQMVRRKYESKKRQNEFLD